MEIILAILIFVLSVLTFNLIIYLLIHRVRRVEERLQFALGHTVQTQSVQPVPSREKGARRWTRLLSFPATVLNRTFLDKYQVGLIRAGIPLKAEEMIGIQGAVLILFIGLGLLVSEQTWGVCLLGIFGFLAPVLVIKVQKTRRVMIFEGQLLDAVLLLANALRAGHSFGQGLEIISRDMPAPLSGEFSKVSRETKIGISLDEALINLTRRIESKDLEMFVTGILIQHQIGGDMAEILDNIAHTIDKRIKNRAKIKAITAQTRLSAWIVSLLPIVLAVYIFGSHPDYGKIMLVEPIGTIMLAVGGVMMLLGILAIRVVIRIDI